MEVESLTVLGMMWFADKVPEDRVLELYLTGEDVMPLKYAIGDDFIPFPEAES